MDGGECLWFSLPAMDAHDWPWNTWVEGAFVFKVGYHPCKMTFKTHPYFSGTKMELKELITNTCKVQWGGGCWCKKGVLKFLDVWKWRGLKIILIFPEIWVYMIFVGLTPIFLGEKEGPEKFSSPKGPENFFHYFFFFFCIRPPYKCLWTVSKYAFLRVFIFLIFNRLFFTIYYRPNHTLFFLILDVFAPLKMFALACTYIDWSWKTTLITGTCFILQGWSPKVAPGFKINFPHYTYCSPYLASTAILKKQNKTKTKTKNKIKQTNESLLWLLLYPCWGLRQQSPHIIKLR